MKNIHASDLNIQKFTFDRLECEPQIIEHIRSCKKCNERVETYKSLSTIIKNQPEPALEYNLSKLVLDQLPSAKKIETDYNYLTNIIVLTIVGFIILALFLFKETITYLLDNTLIYQTYLIISIIVFISAVLAFDLFRSFDKKIKMLNP